MFENSRLLEILTHVIVLFTAFPVHECAHAWAAEKMGDDTARKAGRITLNPIKHLSLFGTLCMIFMGFGWANPVPVNPNKFKNPKVGMALTSLAGPASNLVMAFISTVIFRVLVIVYEHSHASYAIYIALLIFQYAIVLNIGLAVFNLLPIPPLDGSRIFNLILSDKAYFKIMQYEKYVFIALMVVIYTGLLDEPLYFLQDKTLDVMLFLTDWIDVIGDLFHHSGRV